MFTPATTLKLSFIPKQMIVVKETVNKLTTSLEAFATSVRDLNETVEDILLIFEEAQQQAEIDALRVTQFLSIEGIQNVVCYFATTSEMRITVADLKAQSRKREYVEARQIAMLLCRELIKGLSLKKIGEAFGDRDHSTVIYSCETALDLIDTDKQFKNKYIEIKRKLKTEIVENNTTFEQSSI